MTPEKKRGRSEAAVFLDNFTDFLGDTEGQNLVDIKNELREEGIDVDAFVSKVKGLIVAKSAEAKRSWLGKAQAGRTAALEEINSLTKDIPRDISALKDKIRQLLVGPSGKLAGTHFRNYQNMTDEDIRGLYADYLMLMQMKEKKEADDKGSQ